MAGEEEFWEKDHLLSESLCSTYSEVSDKSSGGVKTNSDQLSEETSPPSMTILQQTAPFLLLGTDSQTLSPMQSWHSVLAELRGPRRIWTVTLFSFLAAFSAILSGYTLAFPSSALIDLRNNMTNKSRFVKGSSIEDYFGAMAPIGAIFGAAIAGFLSDVLGRKPTLILTGLPHVIGWLFLAGSYDLRSIRSVFILFLLIGRFLSGVGMGWAMLIAPIYIAEISVPVMRGFYSALPQLALSLGIPLAYCCGYLMYYQSSLVATGIAIFCSLLAIFIPESPRYLLSKGRREKACQVLIVLRGKKKSVLSKEIFELDNLVYKQRKLSCSEWLSELRQRQVFIPLILCLFVLIFQQLSGINALFFYGAPILQEAGVAKSEFMALLAIGLTEFVTTLLTVFIVDLFGRKYMLMLSSFIMMCSCTGLSTHLYLKDSSCLKCDGSPLAIISVIMLIVGFSLGLGAVPWTLMTELLPLRVRGFLGGVLSAVNWAFAAVVTGLYLEFAAKSSESVAWWMFAGINMVAFAFVAFFLPETKGKKLEFIEQQMKNNFKLCA